MIKIIAGVYGYKENGIILPKDKDSEPFSLDPEREAELVAQGVAEYANVIIPDGRAGARTRNRRCRAAAGKGIRQNRKQRNQSRIWSRKLTETKILRAKTRKARVQRQNEAHRVAGTRLEAYGLDAQNIAHKGRSH